MARRWTVALAPAALLLATASAEDAGVVRAMDDAQAALEAGDAARAETLYRRAAEASPGYAEAWAGLARALGARGRRDEAVEILLGVGQGLVYSGRHEAGRALLDDAVELAPRSGATRAALGHALLLLKQHAGAVAELERAVELGERAPAVDLLLGSAYWEAGRVEASETVYRRALARAPEDGALLQSLGGLLLWQGRYAEAAELLGRAVARGAGPPVRLDLARALEGAGRETDAMAAYEQVLRQAPDLYPARYSLARLLARTGRTEEARREMERFREAQAAGRERTRREQLDGARLEHGWALVRAGRPEEAERHFAALDTTPASLAGLAASRSARGDHEGAAWALARAVALDPARYDLRLELARERLGGATRAR